MSKRKQKTVYRIKWKNLFKFLLTIFILVIVIMGIVKVVNIYSNYKEINDIKDKSYKYKKDTLVDDNKTTTIKPKENISKFDEYYNYIKLGMLNIDIKSLKKINKNIVGYIEVKGTNISYPIILGDSKYNSYSLNNKENIFGSLYTNNNYNDIPNNLVIYGKNNMFNILFGELNTLFKPLWQNNGSNFVIKYASEDYTSIYEIVSIYKSKSINNYDDIINKSVYDFNTGLDSDDKLITLVGLDKDNIIVHGKLIKYKKM